MPVDTANAVMEEVGCVVSTKSGKAVVRIPRSKECAGCHGCSMMDDDQGMMAEADNPVGAAPGDTVRLETRGVEGKIKAALLLYGFPLAMMLAGAIGSQPLWKSLHLGAAVDGLSVLSGLLLMAASFALLYWIRKRAGKHTARSRIVEILEHS
jgi:positive regulator of sigma E activity